MTKGKNKTFIETKEYRRFREFCDACRRDCYIGLCYGPPGVGKTLSAQHYTRWDKVEAYSQTGSSHDITLNEVVGCDAVFYTVPVINSPGQMDRSISQLRGRLHSFVHRDIEREQELRIAEVKKQEIEEQQEELRRGERCLLTARSTEETLQAITNLHAEYGRKYREALDPTRLIIVDEADRLKMAGLEQLRDIFDGGDLGVVLIGMPGIEKRLARYPQLYSRVGFVHAFRPLSAKEVRTLLQDNWTPPGVSLPVDSIVDEEAMAAIIRISGGNFRLLHRLLTQVARLLEINALTSVTREAVEAARESLVIGTA
jgi:DNA transposition AAA+ family ATPase